MYSSSSVVRVDPRHQQRVEQWTLDHGKRLHALARRWCRAPLDPDDLVQDALERALRSTVPEAADERAWLARVMRNLFIDRVRQQAARRAQLERRGLPVADDEDGPWWERLTDEHVRAEVERLPAPQRTTFELFTFAGKSYDAIAEQLGISKNTVGTRVLRARQALRVLLTERYGA